MKYGSRAREARVIGLVPHQITTDSLRYPIEGKDIPDLDRDILKVVVCSRYRDKACGVGLVHGFALERGAIASSISHDAHNIIAAGTSDAEIRRRSKESSVHGERWWLSRVKNWRFFPSAAAV